MALTQSNSEHTRCGLPLVVKNSKPALTRGSLYCDHFLLHSAVSGAQLG